MCAWSGGSYTKGNSGTGGWTGDAASGIGIEAGRHDTQDNDFASGINNCLTKDGQNNPTANLPMSGFKHTGVANGSANTDYMAYGQIRNGTPLYMDTTNNRLGIGTSTPTVQLDIQDASNSTGAIGTSSTRFSADTVPPECNLKKSRGATVGTNTIVSNSDFLGAIRFWGANGTGYTQGAVISAIVDGIPGATNDMPSALQFYTSADGSGTPTERVRISSLGQTYFNSTVNRGSVITVDLGPSAGVNDTGIAMKANTNGNYGMAFLNASASNVGRIQIDAAATQYVTTSDYRLKDNVQPILNALNRLSLLKPSAWDWKQTEGSSEGFLAHELAEICPTAVSGIKDAVDSNGSPIYQGVDYGKITPLLTAAIQELCNKVEALEARVAELEK